MKQIFKVAIIILIGSSTISLSQAAQTKRTDLRKADRKIERFAMQAFKKLLQKKKFKLKSVENRPLQYEKDELTYTQNLAFQTTRGYICQGGLSFEISLDKKVEKDSLWTNLSCYKVRKSRRKRRKS